MELSADYRGRDTKHSFTLIMGERNNIVYLINQLYSGPIAVPQVTTLLKEVALGRVTLKRAMDFSYF